MATSAELVLHPVRLHLQGEKLSSVLVGDADADGLARTIEAAR